MSNLNEESGLRFYSLGIVVQTKSDDGDFIQVTPIETLPLVKGQLSTAAFNYNTKGQDHMGVPVQANVKGGAYVVAQWAGFDSGNRNTAPNVAQGETVALWKYGNNNDIFWQDLFREPGLRRLENVVHSFSNLSKPGSSYDQNSSYWFQVSTRDKKVQFHTSDNDGEPVTYDVIFDTAQGTLTIEDGNSNSIVLDSKNSNLTININNDVTWNIGNDLNINVGNDSTYSVKNVLKFIADQILSNGQTLIQEQAPTIKEQATETISSQAPVIHDQASTSITQEAPQIGIDASTGLSFESGGTTNIQSAETITSNANIQAPDMLTNSGVSLKDHKHKYIPGDGSPTDTSPSEPS